MPDDVFLWQAVPFKIIDLGDETFALAVGAPATHPIPVTGPLTDTELRASPVPVVLGSEGTIDQAVPSQAVYIGVRSEGNLKPLKVDPLVGGLVGIDVAHYEIHEGDHYFIKDFTTLNNGQTLSFALTVPAEGPIPHITFDVGSTNILTASIYEGAVIQDGTGSGVTPNNNNRNSGNSSGVVVTSNPTYSSPGTLISRQQWASRTPGLITREDELILKLGATTRFDLASGANGNVVNYDGRWYEES